MNFDLSTATLTDCGNVYFCDILKSEIDPIDRDLDKKMIWLHWLLIAIQLHNIKGE